MVQVLTRDDHAGNPDAFYLYGGSSYWMTFVKRGGLTPIVCRKVRLRPLWKTGCTRSRRCAS